MKLPRQFYNWPTLKVAQDLLGKVLVRKLGQKKLLGRIVETEAYVGPNDRASHAWRGLTPRTALMFGPPGFAYIYLIYGMYYCFNVVTEKEGYPAAVLIRTIELFDPKKSLLISGPGKLCRALKIDKRLNDVDLTGNTLWIEDWGEKISKNKIVRAKRVGVDYAQEYKNKLWRFFLKD